MLVPWEQHFELHWPCILQNYFFDFIDWTLFSIMFSSEANTSEAARDCWCCQLFSKLVTELSAQCSCHLSSWQRAVASELQTHFSITPLSHPPSAHFIHLLHLILCLYSSSILSPLLSYLHCPFPHCIILLSAIHPDWTHRRFLCSHHIFSLNFPSSHILWFTHISSSSGFHCSLSTSHLIVASTFHCLQLKNVCTAEVTAEEYSYKGARLL